MKLKLLLFLMILAGILHAQEPNRSLVITEARLDGLPDIHIELTNMGNTDINLNEYKFGMMNPWAPGQVDSTITRWMALRETSVPSKLTFMT